MKKKQKVCAECGGKLNDLVIPEWERRKRGGRLVIFKNVPCQECSDCGKRYFDGPMSKQMDAVLEGRVATTGLTQVATYRIGEEAA